MKTLGTLISASTMLLLSGLALAEQRSEESEAMTVAASNLLGRGHWKAQDLRGTGNTQDLDIDQDPFADLNQQINDSMQERVREKLDLQMQAH